MLETIERNATPLAVKSDMPDAAQKPKLLAQVRDRIRVKHYSLSTEKTYLYWIKFYIHFHHLKTGKWGASGEEFQTLRKHLGNLADYFARQPVHRIESARQWVLRINKKMQEAGALSADIGDDMELENVVRAA